MTTREIIVGDDGPGFARDVDERDLPGREPVGPEATGPRLVSIRVMSAGPGSVVVVGCEGQARRIVRPIRPLRPCMCVGSLDALTHELAASPAICGVISCSDADGGGLAAIERVRAVAGHVPALLLVAAPDDRTMAEAFERRVSILPRSASDGQLQRFGLDCMIADFEPDDAVRAALIETARRYGLTAVEIEVVHAAVHGRRFDWFLRECKLSHAAYKARVLSILRKTMADDLSCLVREILWLALQRDRESMVG